MFSLMSAPVVSRKPRFESSPAVPVPATVLSHRDILTLLVHRQPKLNIREPLNYKNLYGNTTDLCKMVETNIVLSIKST